MRKDLSAADENLRLLVAPNLAFGSGTLCSDMDSATRFMSRRFSWAALPPLFGCGLESHGDPEPPVR
jgi:hypothetical protein